MSSAMGVASVFFTDWIGVVTGDVTLPQDPGPRKAALLRAAENCIVRNTLVNPPEIDLEITGASPEKNEG